MTEFVTLGEWVKEVERVTGTTQKQYENSTRQVSRVTACVLLAQALPGLNTGIAGNLMPPYRDLDSLTAEQKDAVRYLYHTGIMFGYDDNTFKPNQPLAANESSEIAARALQRVQAKKQPVPYEVIEDTSTLPIETSPGLLPEQGRPGLTVVQSGDGTYAIVTAAEKPTAGYQIVPDSVVQGKGRIEILVRVEAPAPDQMVAQMITYPQLILKFAPTTQPIVVVNPEILQ